MSFFHFRQNNSGGHFTIRPNRGIGVHVIIEADSPEEANDRAEEIGLYFDGEGDCPCCGNRWYAADSYDAEPLIAMMPSRAVFVHYADGSMEEF